MEKKNIFEIKGDKERKKEARLNYKKDAKIFKEYEKKCSDWKKIHLLYFKIIEQDTTLKEAINYFVEICKIFINSMETKKMSFKEGGFAEKLFDDFPFHYTSKIYELFDGELYGVAELLGNLKDEKDFENLKKEFEVFTKKYGF